MSAKSRKEHEGSAGSARAEASQTCRPAEEGGDAPSAEPMLRPWEQPGNWAKDSHAVDPTVWLALYVQVADRGAAEKGSKRGSKRATKKAVAAGMSERQSAATEADPTQAEAPRVLALRSLLRIDKIVRAAANQASALKKRDIDTARVFLAADIDGVAGPDLTEVKSDADAKRLLSQDGAVIVIAAGGGEPKALSEEVLTSMRHVQADLRGRGAALASSRASRQLEREAELKESCSSDMAPVLFWKDTDRNGYLSNWARSPFQVDGIRYNCAEQYIMWSKAVVMDDESSAQKILATNDPQTQKRLGRQVQHWKDGLWKRQREPVMVRAARAKFSQNPELQERLIKTHPRRMAEASPSDKIYGIGLAPDDPLAQNPQNWRGENLLGRVLEQIREELVQQCST